MENLASNAIGASAMRPPTLMMQPSNMGQRFTILLKRLTWTRLQILHILLFVVV